MVSFTFFEISTPKIGEYLISNLGIVGCTPANLPAWEIPIQASIVSFFRLEPPRIPYTRKTNGYTEGRGFNPILPWKWVETLKPQPSNHQSQPVHKDSIENSCENKELERVACRHPYLIGYDTKLGGKRWWIWVFSSNEFGWVIFFCRFRPWKFNIDTNHWWVLKMYLY